MAKYQIAGALVAASLAVAVPAGAGTTHHARRTDNPVVSILPASVRAPRVNARLIHFRVQLDQRANKDVTFDYKTAGGSAVIDSDFDSDSGTATIPAGKKSVKIDITVEPGMDPMGPPRNYKTFRLRLSKLVGGTFANGNPTMVGTGFILDNTVG